uniref:NACHT LRR and PYD domain-containing protein n=1 Tax=Sinocyclocheilus grahami TaxID=75366 RepID=A0A672P257_SINGR
MKQTGSSSTSNKKTAEYIKKKISTSRSPDKSINLFHCLNELGDHSLVEKVQDYVKSGTLSDAKFSSSQWSAVVFLLLTSETKLDEFYLKKFVGRKSKSENVKVLQKLLPVVKESRSVQLCDCDITDEGCAALTSALRSDSSHLRELNLSGIKLGDSGVKQLSAGLENLHCKLEILLRNCGVTDKGCAALASALSLNPSHLRKLDLSMNELGNSGVNLLSAGLENPHCKLQTLTLSNCGVTNKGLAALTSALASNPSHLRNLNLAENKLQNSGVELLSDVLENPHCKLEILWLRRCNVTDAGCDDLASALISNPSHIRQLNLSWNKLGNAGVKLLSDVLENPPCKLELLWLINCGVTDEGCVALASALRSNPSHLRELDLFYNKLGDSVKLLSALKDDPYYKLDRLNSYC